MTCKHHEHMTRERKATYGAVTRDWLCCHCGLERTEINPWRDPGFYVLDPAHPCGPFRQEDVR